MIRINHEDIPFKTTAICCWLQNVEKICEFHFAFGHPVNFILVNNEMEISGLCIDSIIKKIR